MFDSNHENSKKFLDDKAQEIFDRAFNAYGFAKSNTAPSMAQRIVQALTVHKAGFGSESDRDLIQPMIELGERLTGFNSANGSTNTPQPLKTLSLDFLRAKRAQLAGQLNNEFGFQKNEETESDQSLKSWIDINALDRQQNPDNQWTAAIQKCFKDFKDGNKEGGRYGTIEIYSDGTKVLTPKNDSLWKASEKYRSWKRASWLIGVGLVSAISAFMNVMSFGFLGDPWGSWNDRDDFNYQNIKGLLEELQKTHDDLLKLKDLALEDFRLDFNGARKVVRDYGEKQTVNAWCQGELKDHCKELEAAEEKNARWLAIQKMLHALDVSYRDPGSLHPDKKAKRDKLGSFGSLSDKHNRQMFNIGMQYLKTRIGGDLAAIESAEVAAKLHAESQAQILNSGIKAKEKMLNILGKFLAILFGFGCGFTVAYAWIVLTGAVPWAIFGGLCTAVFNVWLVWAWLPKLLNYSFDKKGFLGGFIYYRDSNNNEKKLSSKRKLIFGFITFIAFLVGVGFGVMAYVSVLSSFGAADPAIQAVAALVGVGTMFSLFALMTMSLHKYLKNRSVKEALAEKWQEIQAGKSPARLIFSLVLMLAFLGGGFYALFGTSSMLSDAFHDLLIEWGAPAAMSGLLSVILILGGSMIAQAAFEFLIMQWLGETVVEKFAKHGVCFSRFEKHIGGVNEWIDERKIPDGVKQVIKLSLSIVYFFPLAIVSIGLDVVVLLYKLIKFFADACFNSITRSLFFIQFNADYDPEADKTLSIERQKQTRFQVQHAGRVRLAASSLRIKASDPAYIKVFKAAGKFGFVALLPVWISVVLLKTLVVNVMGSLGRLAFNYLQSPWFMKFTSVELTEPKKKRYHQTKEGIVRRPNDPKWGEGERELKQELSALLLYALASPVLVSLALIRVVLQFVIKMIFAPFEWFGLKPTEYWADAKWGSRSGYQRLASADNEQGVKGKEPAAQPIYLPELQERQQGTVTVTEKVPGLGEEVAAAGMVELPVGATSISLPEPPNWTTWLFDKNLRDLPPGGVEDGVLPWIILVNALGNGAFPYKGFMKITNGSTFGAVYGMLSAVLNSVASSAMNFDPEEEARALQLLRALTLPGSDILQSPKQALSDIRLVVKAMACNPELASGNSDAELDQVQIMKQIHNEVLSRAADKKPNYSEPDWEGDPRKEGDVHPLKAYADAMREAFIAYRQEQFDAGEGSFSANASPEDKLALSAYARLQHLFFTQTVHEEMMKHIPTVSEDFKVMFNQDCAQNNDGGEPGFLRALLGIKPSTAQKPFENSARKRPAQLSGLLDVLQFIMEQGHNAATMDQNVAQLDWTKAQRDFYAHIKARSEDQKGNNFASLGGVVSDSEQPRSAQALVINTKGLQWFALAYAVALSPNAMMPKRRQLNLSGDFKNQAQPILDRLGWSNAYSPHRRVFHQTGATPLEGSDPNQSPLEQGPCTAVGVSSKLYGKMAKKELIALSRNGACSVPSTPSSEGGDYEEGVGYRRSSEGVLVPGGGAIHK